MSFKVPAATKPDFFY